MTTEKQWLNIIFKPIDISTIVCIYYYLNDAYGVKKSLEKCETKYIYILMCTGLSFVNRLYNNATNIISKTAKNYQ